MWFFFFHEVSRSYDAMLFFSALSLLWLLLHNANASLSSSYLAAVQTASAKYQNSSLLIASGNSSSLANGTTLTTHAATTPERTHYDVWTVTSTDVDGNTNTFNRLVALGLSESEIYIVGAAPGLADVNLFQVTLTDEMYFEFVPEVGASSLPFTLSVSHTFSSRMVFCRATSTWWFQLV